MLKPLHDYVAIEVQNKTVSGIVLTSSNHNSGIVVGIGSDVQNPEYHIGSLVYFEASQAVDCGSSILIQDKYIMAEVVQ